MIGVSNRKHPRLSGARGGSNKEAPQEKRLNTMEKIFPLKTLSLSLPKTKEASGTVSDKGRVSSPPITRSKPRSPDEQLEYWPLISVSLLDSQRRMT